MNFYEVIFNGVIGQDHVLIIAPSYDVVLNYCKSEKSAYGFYSFTIEEKRSSTYVNDGFWNKIKIVENCPKY